jgi:hypothetical protein
MPTLTERSTGADEFGDDDDAEQSHESPLADGVSE